MTYIPTATTDTSESSIPVVNNICHKSTNQVETSIDDTSSHYNNVRQLFSIHYTEVDKVGLQ